MSCRDRQVAASRLHMRRKMHLVLNLEPPWFLHARPQKALAAYIFLQSQANLASYLLTPHQGAKF